MELSSALAASVGIIAQVTAGFTGLSLLSISPASAQVSPEATVAQLFYPAPNAQPTIQVLGQGEASAPAQEGVLKLTFDKVYGEDYAFNEETGEYDYSQPLEAPAELSEAMFASILEAWQKDFGLTDSAIAITLQEDTATVTATVSQPQQIVLQQMAEQAMGTMVDNDDVSFSSLDVKYRITDCQPLREEVFRNAIADAKTRAITLAEAMGVTLAGLPSVAESPFNLIAPPSCNEEASLFNFANFTEMFSGAQVVEKEAEVTIRRDIFVTYPIQ